MTLSFPPLNGIHVLVGLSLHSLHLPPSPCLLPCLFPPSLPSSGTAYHNPIVDHVYSSPPCYIYSRSPLMIMQNVEWGIWPAIAGAPCPPDSLSLVARSTVQNSAARKTPRRNFSLGMQMSRCAGSASKTLRNHRYTVRPRKELPRLPGKLYEIAIKGLLLVLHSRNAGMSGFTASAGLASSRVGGLGAATPTGSAASAPGGVPTTSASLAPRSLSFKAASASRDAAPVLVVVGATIGTGLGATWLDDNVLAVHGDRAGVDGGLVASGGRVLDECTVLGES